MKRIVYRSSRVSLPKACAAVLSFIFLGFVAVPGQMGNSITVATDTVIESDRIDLGSIASISGETVAADRLRKISLGYSPNVGMSREIDRTQIALAIAAAGFAEGEFALVTPAKIVVRRSGQNVSEDAIRKAIESSVAGQFAAEGVSVTLMRVTLPPNIQVPSGNLEIRVRDAGSRNLFERFSLPVDVRIDNRIMRTFSATIEIEATAEVFVAVADLAANAMIGEKDVRLEKRRLVRPVANYIRDVDSLRGVKLLKNLAAGEVLTSDSCVSAVVVRAGDTVSIEARSGNLKIVIKGEARTSGKIGDHIAVKNSQSGAILQAVIIDEGLVRVIF